MLSLYIHIPYCAQKCLYCGFYSTIYAQEEADRFISALEIEVQNIQKSLPDRRIDTIYLGGGTPTVLSPTQLDRVVRIIERSFAFEKEVEFTVEANPHTAVEVRLEALLGHGVNRLSLGVQSFSDDILNSIGRLHDAKQAVDSFCLARSIGFKSISIDLIFGLPGQTIEDWERTIDTAVLLKPDHISAYSFSLEKDTHFMRMAKAGKLTMLNDEIVAGMYELAVCKLNRHGFDRYEISNFCRPGHACRHNQHYWIRGEYLGLGPAASSFFAGQRYDNTADVSSYIRLLSTGLSPVVTREAIGRESAARESIMLGMRTARGVGLSDYKRDYGCDSYERLREKIVSLEGTGLLFVSDERVRLTDRGFLLSDDVVTRLTS